MTDFASIEERILGGTTARRGDIVFASGELSRQGRLAALTRTAQGHRRMHRKGSVHPPQQLSASDGARFQY